MMVNEKCIYRVGEGTLIHSVLPSYSAGIYTASGSARPPEKARRLYNNLQLRKVRVSAEVEYLLSPEEIAAKSPQELNLFLQEKFSFDYFLQPMLLISHFFPTKPSDVQTI